MRKEAISTFNEGLNFDLNPITTPDNVLTDCVNGTFITFNGDELALQSSLGNKVLTSLSPGFHPIGMKEYGGVLYIVSAKPPTIVPEEYDTQGLYDKGVVVYKTIAEKDYFYESLIGANSFDIANPDKWLYVGTEKDFKNRYSTIEFGSFPSVINYEANVSTNAIDVAYNNLVRPLDILHKPIVIVENFNAGMYVSFQDLENPEFNPANFSYNAYIYNSSTQKVEKDDAKCERKIYKVRLLQQLTSGFIDITEDAWRQLAEFHYKETGLNLNQTPLPIGTIHTWFTYPNFKYFALNNYKGNLLMSVELEDYDDFYLSNIKTGRLSETIQDHVPLRFSFRILNNSGWNPGRPTPTLDICYSPSQIPNFETAIEGVNYIENNVEIEQIGTKNIATIQIPQSIGQTTLDFKIRLLFYSGTDDHNLVTYDELPEDFSSKYIISQKVKITYPVITYVLWTNQEDVFCESNFKVGGSVSVRMFFSSSSGAGYSDFVGPTYESTGTDPLYKFVHRGGTLWPEYRPADPEFNIPEGPLHQYLLGSYIAPHPEDGTDFPTYIELESNSDFHKKYGIELSKYLMVGTGDPC